MGNRISDSMTNATTQLNAPLEAGSLPTAPAPRPGADEEFQYHPVTPLAPITLFLGVCSAFGFVGVPAISVGIVGAAVGAIALWQIRRAQGELGGRLVARLGLGFSLLFGLGSGGYHAAIYATEVPEGYKRISFNWLSQQTPIVQDSQVLLPAEVVALEDQPVFIKGYMYPSRRTEGLQEFVLVKDTASCCFGGQPKLTDMIIVRMQDGLTANYRPQTLVSVAGYFHANGVQSSGELFGLFSLDGTHFK
jgi:hypothetical protein